MQDATRPLDPDAAPPHRDARLIALVFAGGTLGTALRAAIGLIAPGSGPTVVINLVGALVLGLLLGVLAARGPDAGRRRAVRLAVGTGGLGGFTTYSAMATDAAGAALHGGALEAVGILVATVLGGLLAAALGLALGGRLGRPA